jgi:hypothetical protein
VPTCRSRWACRSCKVDPVKSILNGSTPSSRSPQKSRHSFKESSPHQPGVFPPRGRHLHYRRSREVLPRRSKPRLRSHHRLEPSEKARLPYSPPGLPLPLPPFPWTAYGVVGWKVIKKTKTIERHVSKASFLLLTDHCIK